MPSDFKNYTVSNALNRDIERFKAYIPLTPDKKTFQAFTRVLDLAEGKNEAPNELFDKYQDALAEIEALKNKNKDLENTHTIKLHEVKEDFLQHHENEINQLKNEIEALKSNPKTTGNAFIFEPTEQQYQQMRRTISYLIKQGKLNRSGTDLPQQLTAKAITYLIKNEYSHILK